MQFDSDHSLGQMINALAKRALSRAEHCLLYPWEIRYNSFLHQLFQLPHPFFGKSIRRSQFRKTGDLPFRHGSRQRSSQETLETLVRISSTQLHVP